MNYTKMMQYDINNWDGVTATIFFSGCKFRCPGCFNIEAWSFDCGQQFDKKAENTFLSYCQNKHVDGVCLLGGEVFQQDLYRILDLVVRIKRETKKPIHVWSGYTFEELLADGEKRAILTHIDTLVDGPFIFAKKDLRLKYRGSSNQRIIDVQKSLATGEVVLLEEGTY